MAKQYEAFFDGGSCGGRTVSITELLEEKVEMLEKKQTESDLQIENLKKDVSGLVLGLLICFVGITILIFTLLTLNQ